MLTIKIPREHLTLAGMAVLMAATRFHHEGAALFLPDASLAIFFLGGYYLGTAQVLAVLLGEAFLIDYLAITQGVVGDYCISPAYAFLVPTYGVMWFGAKWVGGFKRQGLASALPIAAVLFATSSLAFLISNGSFYLFSGRFADVTLMDYGAWIARLYFPYVGATTTYAALAIGLPVVFRSLGARGAFWGADLR